MYEKCAFLFGALITVEGTEQGLLSKLAEYGILGVMLALMIYKDWKNEQFLQKLINDLKKSLDKMSDTIDKKIK
jgi:hypothetical protein